MIRIILILSVAAGLFSCNTADKDTNNKNYHSLFPLGDMEWIYEYDQESIPKTQSLRIKYSYGSFGQFYAIFESFPCLGRWDTETIIAKKSDGSYSMQTGGENLMFIPPTDKIKTGYQWKSSEWNCTIADDKEDVVISGKTYKDCVHITFSASITFWGEMWLKEGVGIVKWQFLRTNPPTTELGHYLLKTY